MQILVDIRRTRILFSCSLLLTLTLAGTLAAADPFRDPKLPIEERVNDLVSLMTLDEKIAFLGQMTPAIERLGIKSFTNFTEGLHGLGWAGGGSITSTQFPQDIGMASTWDPDLLQQMGAAVGYETRIYNVKTDGKRVGLAIRAPMVDLGRDPRWGRNEESYGEDPFLDGSLAVAIVKGLQGDNAKYLQVATTLKHFVANNNEQNRTRTDSVIDERDLREYFLAPFQKAITESHAQSFMVAYNVLNGAPCTAHPILRSIVMKEWGFDGMICTDAGGMPNLMRSQKVVSSLAEAAAMAVKAGVTVFLDQYAASVRDALSKNLLTEADIVDRVKGNLRMRMRLGEFDPPELVPYSAITGKEAPWYGPKHKALARLVTDRSIVLLKNENGILPLSKTTIHSIAVIGGSGNEVFPDWYAGTLPYAVTPVEGIRAKVVPTTHVRWVRDNTNNRTAANIAADSDVAIVFVGNNPTCGAGFGRGCLPSEGKESVDRTEIDLPREQSDLVNQILRANRKTIVVLKASFPYAINAIQESVPGIVYLAHSSQEEGNALADVLFGDYNPAGRLVQTWVKSVDDLPDMMDYDIRKGRTYLYFKGKPLYPFGYGLSYTTFQYSNLRTSADTVSGKGQVTVSVTVRNSGTRLGDEVVQMYVQHVGSAVERPIKQLRGFKRITLKPGELQTVQIPLKGSDLAYWDAALQSWMVENDKLKIMVGSSSADLLLDKTIDVTGN
jgi:beta-glucosidase